LIFPASPALTNGALDVERREVQAARHVLELHDSGKYAEAGAAWDALLASGLVTLNIRRLALGSAVTRDALKDNESAYVILEQATDEEAPFDVRGKALVSRGILADRLGHRKEAIQYYDAAIKHFDSRPEFTAFAPVKEIAARGLKRSQAKAVLPISLYDTGLPL
jgi:tetratricopeptide (TPR) repeat protein